MSASELQRAKWLDAGLRGAPRTARKPPAARTVRAPSRPARSAGASTRRVGGALPRLAALLRSEI